MGNPLKIVGTDFTASMHFALHLSQTPNFTTLDSNGRPQDSFQIFIAFNPATANPANPQAVDVLIRGDEIHIAHALRTELERERERSGGNPDRDDQAAQQQQTRDWQAAQDVHDGLGRSAFQLVDGDDGHGLQQDGVGVKHAPDPTGLGEEQGD